MMDERKKHFVVVHGACHGAWCWYKVAALLRAEGHKVSALDMAASGIHPKRAEEVGSMAEYNQPLTEFMAALPADEKVVLVGHSQGGINISLAMEAFPHNISVAVFVAAFMYGPHLSHRAIKQEFNRQLESYMDTKFEYKEGEDKEPHPVSILFGHQMLQKLLYQLSPPEDLSLAKLLVRGMPMWRDGNNGDDEEYALSEEKYGSVKRVYVVCGKDKSLKEEYQRWLIQMNPTHEVCVIPHADHMPMFSQPHQLSSCLQLISHKYHHSSSS
ncbi:PREDICTED: methylesterase 3-like isoform X2 [Ipomoea nil]|uniref:methylesterase 3-like isoform X2 n=1 Tax=Ipomoea nil TaxID=35883 RepID=UPI00090172BE|nr:PREDICTED: methylesterase 3-like isoform X2 [Ipomoea nil]